MLSDPPAHSKEGTAMSFDLRADRPDKPPPTSALGGQDTFTPDRAQRARDSRQADSALRLLNHVEDPAGREVARACLLRWKMTPPRKHRSRTQRMAAIMRKKFPKFTDVIAEVAKAIARAGRMAQMRY